MFIKIIEIVFQIWLTLHIFTNARHIYVYMYIYYMYLKLCTSTFGTISLTLL